MPSSTPISPLFSPVYLGTHPHRIVVTPRSIPESVKSSEFCECLVESMMNTVSSIINYRFEVQGWKRVRHNKPKHVWQRRLYFARQQGHFRVGSRHLWCHLSSMYVAWLVFRGFFLLTSISNSTTRVKFASRCENIGESTFRCRG